MILRCLILALLFIPMTALAQVRLIEEIFAPEGSYPKSDYVKVAVIQWAPEEAAPLEPLSLVEAHKIKQRLKLESYIREAQVNGAEFIVTPEFATIGYPDIPELPAEDDNFRTRKDIENYVETISGPTAKHFGQLALELKVWIQIGFPEVDAVTDQYFNSVLVFNPKGEIAAHYRKQSLYQIESGYLSKGSKNVIFNSPMGKVGVAICSDIYAEYVMSKYAKENLDVFSISTSWATYNAGWGYFVRAANRVKAYTLASNHNYFPDSGVINPNGTIQSHIRQSTGVAYGYVPRIKRK